VVLRLLRVFVRPLPAFPRIALVFYYGRFYGEIANQSNNIFFVFVQQKYINFSLLLLFLAKNVQVQQKVSTTSILLRILLCTNILLSITELWRCHTETGSQCCHKASVLRSLFAPSIVFLLRVDCRDVTTV